MTRWTALVGASLLAASAAPAQAGRRIPTIAEVEAIAAYDSLDAEMQFRLAIRYWEMKRWDDVERALRRTVAIDPRYGPAWLALGYLPYDRRPALYEEERRHRVPAALEPAVAEAARLRRYAFLLDPLVNLRVAGRALPETEGVFSFPDLGDATGPYVWLLSLSLFNATRYSLALTGFQTYQKMAFPKQPRDSLPDEFLWYRGLAAAQFRWFDTATADFQALLARSLKRELADTLIRIPIGTNDVRYVLALLYERSGRPADAVRYYQEAATNDLGLFMAHVRLAQLYRGLNMMPQAADEAQRAVAASPDDPSTLVEYAMILRDADRREEAVAALRDAMRRNPHDPRIPFNLGLVLTELSKPAEAREAFARFVAIAPTSYDRQITDAKRRLETLAH